jgi:hypothetical protein
MAYLERIVKASAALKKLGELKPGVSHQCIRHDDLCPVLKAKPDCICNPDILLLLENGKRYEVDGEGHISIASQSIRCPLGSERQS